MKKLIFILLIVIYCSTYTSNTKARPLQSGTDRHQITLGILGMTFGGLAGAAIGNAVEKTLNDHFFYEKIRNYPS